MEQVSGFYFPPSETTSAQFSNMTEISASGFNILIRAKRDGRWWILKALAPAVRNSEVYQSLLQKEFDIMKDRWSNSGRVAPATSFQGGKGAYRQPAARGT